MAIAPSQITDFFHNHKPYSKLNLTQLAFFEDPLVYIAKGYCLLLKILSRGAWFEDNVACYVSL